MTDNRHLAICAHNFQQRFSTILDFSFQSKAYFKIKDSLWMNRIYSRYFWTIYKMKITWFELSDVSHVTCKLRPILYICQINKRSQTCQRQVYSLNETKDMYICTIIYESLHAHMGMHIYRVTEKKVAILKYLLNLYINYKNGYVSKTFSVEFYFKFDTGTKFRYQFHE